jgi:hypothetical protein
LGRGVAPQKRNRKYQDQNEQTQQTQFNHGIAENARVVGVTVHFLAGIVFIAEKGPSSAMEQQLSIRKNWFDRVLCDGRPATPKVV